MADRNREVVPDNWSLVRERALTQDFVRKTIMTAPYSSQDIPKLLTTAVTMFSF